MSKHVLILSGSPHKGGNSDILCDQFMKGAQEAGNQTESSLIMKNRNVQIESWTPFAKGKNDRFGNEVLQSIATLDRKESSFLSHRDPQTVEWLSNMKY